MLLFSKIFHCFLNISLPLKIFLFPQIFSFFSFLFSKYFPPFQTSAIWQNNLSGRTISKKIWKKTFGKNCLPRQFAKKGIWHNNLQKFEKMSYGTTFFKKVVQDINLQRSCIEAQLKKLHNFNPDERVANFPQKNSYGTTISKKVVWNANLQIAWQLAKEFCKSCKENIE